MTVAYSELTRVLPWSLRALGYPFGVADRASFLVANAAAMVPEILDHFRRVQGRARAAVEIDGTGDSALSIRAGGLSLIEIGPATMDFIGARIPQSDLLRCTLSGAVDPELLPAVMLIGAEYGLSCLAIAPKGQARGWVLQTVRNGARRIVRGNEPGTLEAVLAAAPAGLAEAARLVWQTGSTGDIVFLATREGIALPPDEPGVAEVIDADERLLRAYRKGVPVEHETLLAIYDLEKRTWAPSSERSRAQAGFQQAPGGIVS